ncbi:Ribonuclease VapC30 [bacterium YEK0313]|nr:Ribonuclease VapC30 [bacterium YEK0313]
MIAVDTSALMAILLREQAAEACMTALQAEDDLIISAATVAEALIVAARRNVRDEMERLIAELGFRIVDVTPAVAHRVAQAYEMWGKGRHPAALNFGDCFAYELAKDHGSRLLYTGNGFARTDVRAAL